MTELATRIVEILSSPAAKEVYATLLSIMTFTFSKLEILTADLISMFGGGV